jgi:hypothetical protein
MDLRHVLRLRSVVLISGAAVLLAGCFTVVSHPDTSPAQHVTDEGHVVVQNDCAGCHTTNDLWSYHDNAQWMAPSHRNSLSGYYTHRYDQLFLGSRYYNSGYYHRWASYYNTPWWWLGDGRQHYSQPRRHAGTPEVYVGRGHNPDVYDRTERRNEFVPMIGPSTRSPGFMPAGAGQPVRRAGTTGRARTSSGGDREDTSTGRGASPGNSTRVERTPDPPPAAPASQPTTSSTKRSSDDDDKDDDENVESNSGRGSAPSGSERRRR